MVRDGLEERGKGEGLRKASTVSGIESNFDWSIIGDGIVAVGVVVVSRTEKHVEG
jgi:hypothetical protein